MFYFRLHVIGSGNPPSPHPMPVHATTPFRLMETLVDALQFMRTCKSWSAAERQRMTEFARAAADGTAVQGGAAERLWNQLRKALSTLMGKQGVPRVVPSRFGAPFQNLDATLLVQNTAGRLCAADVATGSLTPAEFCGQVEAILDASQQLHDVLTDCATVYTLTDHCSGEAPHWAIDVCERVEGLSKQLHSSSGAHEGADSYLQPVDSLNFVV